MMLAKLIQTVSSTAELIPSAQPPTSGLFGGGLNIFALLGQSEFLTIGGILGFLNILWSTYAILAYLVAIAFLVLYVYASVHKNLYENLQTQELRDMEQMYAEKFGGVVRNSRLQDMYMHADSEQPNDWKLAIIEADIILDDVLKQHGYAGNSLGERLKSISSHQLASLNDAWEAHKVRNRIAHDGTDFILTKRVAQETLAQYQRVFTEFGIT